MADLLDHALDLAARVEKATEDQQHVLLIEASVKIPNGGWDMPTVVRFLDLLSVKAYESAAMMMVPVGCGWFMGWGQTLPDEPMGGARITRNGRFIGCDANYDAIADAEAATPALALTAACLRAAVCLHAHHVTKGAPDAA